MDPRYSDIAPKGRIDNRRETELLSAAEAQRILGVKTQTLYTYVSRGWLRRVPSGQGRRSLYLREDVERLRLRHEARAAHAAAAEALVFGQPVVASAITEIDDHAIRYRGRRLTDVLDQPLEAVAELLWTGDLVETDIRGRWPRPPPVPARLVEVLRARPTSPTS